MTGPQPQPQPQPQPEPQPEPGPPVALPDVVTVTQAFATRMPSQRVVDTITRTEGGTAGDLMTAQAMRVIAFRALLRDHPHFDINALWLHSYDVEVEIETADPTSPNGQTPAPPSAAIGASGPTT